LQQILNEKNGEKSKELAKLMTKVVPKKKLPTYLIDALDYVRCCHFHERCSKMQKKCSQP
jgi:ABC-type dipeptide/oligopeptide/nickel transport system ATPase component